jgi:hypothetical protein
MLYELGIFLAGIVTGVVIVRYGIGLGSKLYVKASDGLPLDSNNSLRITQEHSI